MNRCGATIAFEYIEDGDLWTWKLPNSKAFSSGLKDLNLQYDVGLNPSLFQYVISSLLASLIDGVEITEKLCALLIFGLNEHLLSLDLENGELSEKQKLDEALSKSYEIELGGGAFGNCLAVNADSISELRSELGHQLATKSRSLNLSLVNWTHVRLLECTILAIHDFILFFSLKSMWINLVRMRGIGAVLYRVPELENDQMLKISLRSVDTEDTTLISQGELGVGGHRNASSFMVGSAEFKQWKL
ncbi:hypothetical protein DVH24_023284 [Malus domestica]|nr:hypothetical protein DVH24_023284 [Malus domestica]